MRIPQTGSRRHRAGAGDADAAGEQGARRHAPQPVVTLRRREYGPWIAAVPFFAVYCLISVLRYERRETMSWDLGIFTQAVRQYAHLHAPVVDIREQNLNLLGDHFHPIIATIAPFFAVFPTPVTLLVAQAFLFAVGIVPITRTGMQLLGRGAGYAIGIAFGLSWGIVQAVNFDFHEIAFAVPLLAFSLCAFLRDTDPDDVKAVCWAVPLLFVKEDIAIYTPVIIGMVLHRRFRHDPVLRRAMMAAGIVGGVAVFFLLVKIVIPSFNIDHVYLYWSKGGCIDPANHYGLGKKVSCMFSQEVDGLGVKERTVFLTLAPVVFLALRSPIVLMAVPAFAIKFLTPDSFYWGTDFHYSAVPMIIVFAAAIDALLRMKAAREREAGVGVGSGSEPGAGGDGGRPRTLGRRIGDAQVRNAPAAMLAVAVALTMNFPLSDLLNNATWKIPDRAKSLKAAEAHVPDDVTVETTISMLAPLAARTHTYWIGYPNNTPPPKYVAIDLGPSDWNGEPSAQAYVEQRHPGITYQQVYADTTQDVYVFEATQLPSTG